MKNLLLMIGLFSFGSLSAQEFVNPFDYVGQEHNVGLQYLLENIHSIPPKGEIKNTVVNILKQRYTSIEANAAFDMALENPSIEGYQQQVQQCTSPKLNNAIDDVVVYVSKGYALPELLSYFNEKGANADKTLTGNDLRSYYMFLSVVKHSATFWMPENQGGQNGMKYLSVSPKGSSGKQTFTSYNDLKMVVYPWWKIIVSDALGTVCGGVGGPPGAIAGGICASGTMALGLY